MTDLDVPRYFFAEPRIDASAFIAPSATVICDVEIAAHASVWFGVVMRGDVQAIRIGEGSNIQDGTIVHVSTGGVPTQVGRFCTVGHAAVLHGCTLDDHAFVGFGARVLDDCRIETDGVLAASFIALVATLTVVPTVPVAGREQLKAALQ